MYFQMVARIKNDRKQPVVNFQDLHSLLKNPSYAALLFQSVKSIKWFEYNELLSLSTSSVNKNPDMTSLRPLCEQLYKYESDLYKKLFQQQNPSDYSWFQTAISSGTFKDRLAAHVSMIKRSSLHSLFELEYLVQLLRNNLQHRRECIEIMEILKDIFIQDYLPQQKKLLTIEQHDLSSIKTQNPDDMKRIAILWFLQDKLKRLYSSYLDSLQKISHDPIENIRIKAIVTIQHLLVQRPELEKRLLELLIDKLGDPDHTAAAKTLHLCNKLCK
ncbi:unnamed protein product, partial [Didymodactylos carnosus]